MAGTVHDSRQRQVSAPALICLILAMAVASGCARPVDPARSSGTASSSPSPAGPQPRVEESWDRDALAEALPCLVALSEGESPSLRGVGLDGRIVADHLWKPPRDSHALLLDADRAGPRVAVALTRVSLETPAAIRDSLVALRADGSVVTASRPTTDFPLLSAAVFLGNGDLLWLRRRETSASIETTIGLTDDRTGAISPVVLSGAWPAHRFVAALVSLRAATEVAVVLKMDGTPSPHDDFAVVVAEYRTGCLIARSDPYRDDTLFTLGPGPESGTLVYARAGSATSSQADQLIELTRAGSRWRDAVALDDASCDPGFDFQPVCGGGPDESILFRGATNRTPPGHPARLMLLPAAASAATATGVRLDIVGNQWLWLGKPVR